MAGLRNRLERLLLWRVWERMLEIEFVDRSVALAGKAFVSFFPLVIVVAAFVPESIRSSILTTAHGPARLSGRRAHHRQRSLRVVGRRPQGDRPARPRAHDLLRDLVHDCAAARVPPRVAATAPPRSRRVLAGAGLAAGGAGLYGGARRSARCPRRWARGRPFRHRVTGGDLGAVVVHRVVPPAGRRAGAGAHTYRCDHRHRDGRVRSVRHDLDARGGDEQRSPVRLLRCRPGVGDLVLRCRDLHPDRRVRRTGLRRGHRAGGHAHPRRRRLRH